MLRDRESLVVGVIEDIIGRRVLFDKRKGEGEVV